MKTGKFFLLVVLLFTGFVHAMPLAEKHQFHMLGQVKYRCYAGYSGKKVFDSRTKKVCDNKTYENTVVDKVVAIDIKDEPDPEDSKELAGDWQGNFDFKGRKFIIATSLFKDATTSKYRVRLVAEDDEPTPRKTAVFTEVKNLKDMNPLTIEYSSAGTKEEISFWVEVKPSF